MHFVWKFYFGCSLGQWYPNHLLLIFLIFIFMFRDTGGWLRKPRNQILPLLDSWWAIQTSCFSLWYSDFSLCIEWCIAIAVLFKVWLQGSLHTRAQALGDLANWMLFWNKNEKCLKLLISKYSMLRPKLPDYKLINNGSLFFLYLAWLSSTSSL